MELPLSKNEQIKINLLDGNQCMRNERRLIVWKFLKSNKNQFALTHSFEKSLISERSTQEKNSKFPAVPAWN
jgi:hypothetical protein